MIEKGITLFKKRANGGFAGLIFFSQIGFKANHGSEPLSACSDREQRTAQRPAVEVKRKIVSVRLKPSSLRSYPALLTLYEGQILPCTHDEVIKLTGYVLCAFPSLNANQVGSAFGTARYASSNQPIRILNSFSVLRIRAKQKKIFSRRIRNNEASEAGSDNAN